MDLELKESLLFSVFNTSYMPIEPSLLEDTELVKDVFQDCDSIAFQATFLDRLDLEDVVYLCEHDAISEEDLLSVFINTNYPVSQFTDIILELPIESVLFILYYLREEKVHDVFSIIGTLMDHYQEPVVKEEAVDTWVKVMETQCVRTIQTELENEKGDLSSLNGVLVKMALFPDYGRRMIETFLESVTMSYDMSSATMIQDQVLFSYLIKLAHLIALVPPVYDRYEKQNRWIEESLMLTLLQLQKDEDVLKFILPWPVPTIARCLEQITQHCTHKDTQKRNRSLRLKKQLISLSEKECGKLKKAIRRFDVQGGT